jgi:hypothetical protein
MEPAGRGTGLREACAALEQDLSDPDAAGALRGLLRQAPVPAANALREICDLLDGQGPPPDLPRAAPAKKIGKALRESLLTHPRERQQRHHQLASLLGRVLHVLQGDDIACAIARVTEKTGPASQPRLHALTAECSRALELSPPPVHVACGDERICTALVGRGPFLCVHRAFFTEGAPEALSDAEARWALGRALHHVKSGHAPLLQITPERLEDLVLDQVPFLVRTPIELATKAIGWTRANVAVKKAGELLPKQSRGRKVVDTVGAILPDREQGTVLPEAVHEWVWGWLQGVELSADRAGLLLSGSVRASCSAMLRLERSLRSNDPCQMSNVQLRSGSAAAERSIGLRRLLADPELLNPATAARIRELVCFALSPGYLDYLSPEGV